MEVNVYNIKGEDTGRKVTLNESIFGIEPNDHAIYLDVKQFMANSVKELINRKKEVKLVVLHAKLVVKKVVAVLVVVI
jgi:ribosomal protein L4